MSEVTATVALDWGTTSLRVYRLDGAGTVLEDGSAPLGIMNVEEEKFEEAFEGTVGDWLDAAPEATIVLSGMIGSRQGWAEAPYLACPADVAGLAGAMLEVPLARGRSAWIAPGLSTRNDGAPDVMRGEEVQILGALADLGGGDHLICLPGTHSKWARVSDGRVVGFATHMTGEVFDVLRRHSILGRMIEHAAWDDAAFLGGVEGAEATGGLLSQLFAVRARGLFDELGPETAGAHLSGLLIGHELRAAFGQDRPERVTLIGAAELTDLYAKALSHVGVSCTALEPTVAARGLHQLAQALRNQGRTA
jgi:2-dehydro-3-deoxygalactonokinase